MNDGREKGFTLIETLLAASILTVAIVSVAALFILSMKTNASAGDQTSCVTLAQERMERLKQTPWSDIAVGGSTSSPQPGYSEYVDIDANATNDFVVAWSVAWAPSASGSLSAAKIKTMDLAVKCTSLRNTPGQAGKEYYVSTMRTKGVK